MIDQRFYYKKEEFIEVSKFLEFANCQLSSNLSKTEKFSDIAPLDKAKAGQITFLHNEKYVKEITKSQASACLTSSALAASISELNKEIKLIISDNPYKLYCQVLDYLYGVQKGTYEASNQKIAKSAQIMPGAYIGDNVEIGENSVIYPGVVISSSCKIGNNVIIYPGCYVAFSILEDSVILQSGARIGTDGFGYFSDQSGHHKITHFGRVILEKNVEIGANTTIDRGSVGDTIIGEGTKIDNLVQIAHNVKIGKYCFLTSQVGIAGSTQIGDFVVMGGQTGVSGHLKIGSNNRFAAQSGVTKNILPNSGDFYGMPAKPKSDWQKEQITLRKITKKSKN